MNHTGALLDHILVKNITPTPRVHLVVSQYHQQHVVWQLLYHIFERSLVHASHSEINCGINCSELFLNLLNLKLIIFFLS